MKNTPLITALLILGATIGLNAQTTTILIKSGDPINGSTSNSAKLLSMGNIVMNEIGGIAFQGYASENVTRTNVISITNRTVTPVEIIVPVTNSIITAQTNNVPITSSTIGATNLNRVTYSTNTVVTNKHIVTYVTNTTVGITNQISTLTTTYNGVWTTDIKGQLNLVARSGQPIFSSTNTLSYVTDPVLNDNGASAFIGYSYATNGFTTNTFFQTNSVNGVISTNTFTSPIISSNTAIYLAMPGVGPNNLLPVASIGSPAPGTSANFTSFSNIALPDVGGVIFVGIAGTNQGVWAQDASATVHLIAAQGQTISVGGTNKVIRSFSMMNNGFPGVTRSYSDDTGAIVFQAYFTDGTSAAVKVSR